MNDGLVLTLALTAATVGALHSLAPDHWVPFTALARARGWTAARTARLVALCGFGHVTVSVLLGLLAMKLGREVLEALGRRLEAMAGVLLVGLGLLYAVWGLRRVAGERLHGHSHAHYDHVHDPSRATSWGLFLLFSADPCVALIPILLAAAPLGGAQTAAVVAVYELATIGTMLALVLPARAGAAVFRRPWLDRWGDAVAGATIAGAGLLAMAAGW